MQNLIQLVDPSKCPEGRLEVVDHYTRQVCVRAVGTYTTAEVYIVVNWRLFLVAVCEVRLLGIPKMCAYIVGLLTKLNRHDFMHSRALYGDLR